MIVYIALSILKVTKLHLKMSDLSRAAAQHNCIMGTCVCVFPEPHPSKLPPGPERSPSRFFVLKGIWLNWELHQ